MAADHHVMEGELAEMVFEPREGGRILDRATDGTEFSWSRVLVDEPPERFVFTWDICLQWKIETDHEKTSEVEVRFVPEVRGPHAGRARAPRPSNATARMGAHA